MRGYSSTARTLATPTIGRLAIALLAATLLIAGQRAHAAELHGKVVGVADGDTLTVLDADRTTHRIRLNGIDAPEKGQPYGTRAKEQLAALAFGKPVVVVWNKRDRYGRIVGQVRLAAPAACTTPACSDSGDVGLALIESGLAWHYKRYQNEQAAEDRTRYARAEELARSHRAGLWHDAHPIAPWDYRSNHRAEAARATSTPRFN
jgi:endonuclease YncB( thermonuclease family)